MKIYSIEVLTDAGRRVVKLGAPIEIEPNGAMPMHFRGLTEVLWGVICEVATNAAALAPPKAQA